jgi:hypothetical protein
LIAPTIIKPADGGTSIAYEYPEYKQYIPVEWGTVLGATEYRVKLLYSMSGFGSTTEVVIQDWDANSSALLVDLYAKIPEYVAGRYCAYVAFSVAARDGADVSAYTTSRQCVAVRPKASVPAPVVAVTHNRAMSVMVETNDFATDLGFASYSGIPEFQVETNAGDYLGPDGYSQIPHIFRGRIGENWDFVRTDETYPLKVRFYAWLGPLAPNTTYKVRARQALGSPMFGTVYYSEWGPEVTFTTRQYAGGPFARAVTADAPILYERFRELERREITAFYAVEPHGYNTSGLFPFPGSHIPTPEPNDEAGRGLVVFPQTAHDNLYFLHNYSASLASSEPDDSRCTTLGTPAPIINSKQFIVDGVYQLSPLAAVGFAFEYLVKASLNADLLTSSGWDAKVQSDGSVRLRLLVSGVAVATATSSAGDVTSGATLLVGGKYDGTTLTLYVNGASAGTASYAAVSGFNQFPSVQVIAHQGSDEFAMFAPASLTTLRHAAHYAAITAGSISAPAAPSSVTLTQPYGPTVTVKSNGFTQNGNASLYTQFQVKRTADNWAWGPPTANDAVSPGDHLWYDGFVLGDTLDIPVDYADSTYSASYDFRSRTYDIETGRFSAWVTLASQVITDEPVTPPDPPADPPSIGATDEDRVVSIPVVVDVPGATNPSAVTLPIPDSEYSQGNESAFRKDVERMFSELERKITGQISSIGSNTTVEVTVPAASNETLVALVAPSGAGAGAAMDVLQGTNASLDAATSGGTRTTVQDGSGHYLKTVATAGGAAPTIAQHIFQRLHLNLSTLLAEDGATVSGFSAVIRKHKQNYGRWRFRDSVYVNCTKHATTHDILLTANATAVWGVFGAANNGGTMDNWGAFFRVVAYGGVPTWHAVIKKYSTAPSLNVDLGVPAIIGCNAVGVADATYNQWLDLEMRIYVNATPFDPTGDPDHISHGGTKYSGGLTDQDDYGQPIVEWWIDGVMKHRHYGFELTTFGTTVQYGIGWACNKDGAAISADTIEIRTLATAMPVFYRAPTFT